MERATSILLMSAVAALMPLHVAAQSLTDTIVIEGRLSGLTNSNSGETTLDPEATFVATLEVDRNAPLVFSDTSVRNFDDAVLSSVLELYDGQGVPITTQFPTRCDETAYSSPEISSTASTLFTNGDANRGEYSLAGTDINGRDLSCAPSLSELAAPLFAADVDFPVPLAGDYESSFAMRVSSSARGTVISIDALGTAERITVMSVDSDGDGVADSSDACVSENSATVVFDGWYDSGVSNYADASGCTIMDQYAACEFEEEEQPDLLFAFSFYSGPSYCEKQVSYDMVRKGIIDYREARQLRDALYYAAQNDGLR